MPCYVIAPGVIACSPPDWTYRRIAYCPVCERRRRMVTTLEGFYGSTTGCLGCGDQWSDGEMWGRPFARGWRERAKAQLREKWANAMTREEALAANNRHLFGDLEEDADA